MFRAMGRIVFLGIRKEVRPAALLLAFIVRHHDNSRWSRPVCLVLCWFWSLGKPRPIRSSSDVVYGICRGLPSGFWYAIETSVTCPVGIQVRVSPLRTPWLSWKATEMGRFFDCKNRGPSSQQECHDENPSMIKGRERWDNLIKIRSLTLSCFGMSWQRRINKTRERKKSN